MARLRILTQEDPTLRMHGREVTEITPRILRLLDDMAQTMREAEGCGLAAPQVGVLRRVVVVETEPGELYELINPSILTRAGTQRGVEGCLSVPGKQGIVTRPMYVTVRAQDRTGAWREYRGEGLLARAFCHEIDHLDGKLYTDIAEEMEEAMPVPSQRGRLRKGKRR